MPAPLQVLAQIGVELGTAAPERHVEQPQIVPALLLGGEFAVDLEALLAQPLAGPAEFDAGVLLVQAEEGRGDPERLGLDLGVPQQAAGRLLQPLEGTGQQAPLGGGQQAGRGSVAARLGSQRGVEHLPSAVGVPFGRDPADGDEQMGPPGGGRTRVAQRFAEQARERGRGEHARGTGTVGAQPRVGEGGFPVPVEEFTDGLQGRRRAAPLLELGAQLLVRDVVRANRRRVIRQACVTHGGISSRGHAALQKSIPMGTSAWDSSFEA